MPRRSKSSSQKYASHPGKDDSRGESNRRQQLVQIAFDLIASKGFEGLRFQEVAARAGINNATLYYYFPSKEALIVGVVEYLTERLRSPQVREERQAQNALDELRQMFKSTRKRVKQDTSFFVVITELALRARRDPAIDRIGMQRDNSLALQIADVLKKGVKEGIFRQDLDLDTTAIALMVQIKGVAHHAAMRKRKPGEIDSIISEIAAQVEHWLKG